MADSHEQAGSRSPGEDAHENTGDVRPTNETGRVPDGGRDADDTYELTADIDDTHDVTDHPDDTHDVTGDLDGTHEVTGDLDDTQQVTGDIDVTDDVDGMHSDTEAFSNASPTSALTSPEAGTPAGVTTGVTAGAAPRAAAGAAAGAGVANTRTFAPGQVIARRFRIDDYLAEGGMGQVYRAHDLELDVPLALKTIHPRIASNAAFLRLFKQEVLLARSISHPNVCRIFDLWRDEGSGVWFLTMEFLAGETLSKQIRTRGAFSTGDSLPLARQMAEALDAAHRAGIVHRDFKSPNVVVVYRDDDGKRSGDGDTKGSGAGTANDNDTGNHAVGRAVITDFGLAVTVETGETAQTAAAGSSRAGAGVGAIVGTPAYMAPEQVSGGSIGPASDLYALGVVLFEMCTGRLPFRGKSALETARAHLEIAPPDPRTLTAAIDETWGSAILRLLAKKPGERFATGHDAILALEGRSGEGRAVPHSLPAERDAFVGRNEELRSIDEHFGSRDLESRPNAEIGGATSIGRAADIGTAAAPDTSLLAGADKGAGSLPPASPSARAGAPDPSGSRLLTLLGTGGTGKTRLAQKYGWDSLLRWPGGVWFCEVSEARTELGVARAVASSLRVPLGRQDPIPQLGNAIAGRGRCLIILDNFEQVVDTAGATIGLWLAQAPDARFLVTSRQRLQLDGETVHEVAPLDPMTRGVELFEVRAWGHRPGFMVESSNQKQIQEIVRRLDGLPLAIEMAASRLRGMNAAQLEAGLADRFRILAGAKEGRHATMQATLDWSWDLLSPLEQSVITQLSVFEGGFDLEAAEAVAGLPGNVPGDDAADVLVLDVLQSLVDKSWLRTKAVFGAPRFEMYATVQDYASAKLEARSSRTAAPDGEGAPGTAVSGMNASGAPASGSDAGGAEASDVEVRHGVHYARMGTADAIESLSLAGGATKQTALNLELDNCVVACRRALDRGDGAVAAGTYLAAASVLRNSGPFLLSLELGRQVLPATRDADLRARVLIALATICLYSGEMEESREHFEAALAIHRTEGDRQHEGRVLGNLATLLRVQSQLDDARRLYQESLAIHREIGDRHGEAIVLANLGNFENEQGRTETALEFYSTALSINREIGDRVAEAMALNNLGLVHQSEGRLEMSREYYEEALTIHREVGNRRSEALVLGNLANLYTDQGDLETGEESYEAALSIYRDLGERASLAVVRGNLGLLYADHGRPDAALEQYEAALAIHRAVSNRRFEGIVLGFLGALHLSEERFDAARLCLEPALEIHREIGNRGYEGIALGSFGILHFREGRMGEARKCLEESIAIHRELTDRLLLAKALCDLGEFEVRAGDLPTARAAMAEAEAIQAELALGTESDLAAKVASLREALARG
ncbi:MAG: tetratricopeptide repeat protein [Candidatus Eisenbacteria bacterium]|uniref:Tetratricopeptide repeat protein n=1 Tax=Eiseniibacteriota bacterium TaxID=2212470 RepID=A0A956NHJ8_UNCEI|nr:tetratricopeptide repeat protein [Candidatus Eisenbacteria bacterium]